ILWDNIPNEVYTWNHTPSVSYSDVKGGWSGAGGNNIDVDPNFVDPVAGDFRLRANSPCVDTGDNTATTESKDIDGYQRIIDSDCNGTDVTDMGAYEFNYAYLGDFDYQCDVDLEDFLILCLTWLAEPGDPGWNPICDISQLTDYFIDLYDVSIFNQNWSVTIP
ncbi:MAG: choice-of-anchor Q domain-containing protein, partial [Planctomycetota bacterium]